jgi:hypothetical protein
MALPVPDRTYTRQDIWQLESSGPWDRYSLAYARAVGEMRSRGPNDPTSWSFQSAIHGSYSSPAKPGWNMCQHRSWFFLPWHRMYIYCFELIVRAIVIEQGGPADWALPYWNWTVNRALPPAFRERKLPDGSDNPLFTANRAPGINNGALAPRASVDTTQAFRETRFTPRRLLTGGFGGGAQGPAHFGALGGALETLPHNPIHTFVGGRLTRGGCQEGWMSDPNCAASDPIFWLHHSNVDRLWGRWLNLGGTRANPTDRRWLDQEFAFYDPRGRSVSGRVSEAGLTSQLRYRYADDPPPVARPRTLFGVAAHEPAVPEAEPVGGEAVELTPPKPVELGAAASTVSLELKEEARPQVERLRRGLATEPSEPAAVYLTLQDVEAERDPGIVYGVYLNKPDADPPHDEDSPHFVGYLSFFGLGHEHGEEGEHDEAGPSFVFDVTTLIPQLEDAGGWDPSKAEVTFVPAGLEPPEEEAGPPIKPVEPDDESVPTVRVGRVSIQSE